MVELKAINVFATPNVVTQLTALLFIAMVLPLAGMEVLTVLLGGFVWIIVVCKERNFFRLVKRLKWFFLVMWLIYVFNTPGEHWSWWSFSVAPTYEGLQAANMQMLRILVMLSALAIMLAGNDKETLISGFCALLKPLQWLGLDTERFAARLWLTMHYVETQPDRASGQDLMDFIEQALTKTRQVHEEVQMEIEWDEPVFGSMDVLLILLMASTAFFLV